MTRLWREGCCRAPLNYRRRPLMIKPSQPPFRARELPLWWLAPPPCPVGSMSYDTESKSRNASCVPFRGRGPRSGEGVDGGKNDYDILILCLIALKGKRLTTFCASLRSGGRRLAVRTAMEHPIGALPRTPFPASRDFPSRGNEKIGGTGYCVTYDTDSQSRNAPCVPFRGRGPRSGEGCASELDS